MHAHDAHRTPAKARTRPLPSPHAPQFDSLMASSPDSSDSSSALTGTSLMMQATTPHIMSAASLSFATMNGFPVVLSPVSTFQLTPSPTTSPAHSATLPLTPPASTYRGHGSHQRQPALASCILPQFPFPLQSSIVMPSQPSSFTTLLSSPHQTSTNVQIRGLPPHVNDATLFELGSQFGQVLSVRSVIDKYHGSPLASMSAPCDGTGFIMFERVPDAHRAIDGFKALGLEASLANETVNLKLKRMEDTSSSNLYLSNLPLDFDESDIRRLFSPMQVCSARVLREYDHMPEHSRPRGAMSRGVGFARLADRATAEQAIKRLDKTRLPGSSLPLKIRFADTQEQKAYKKSLESHGVSSTSASLCTPSSSSKSSFAQHTPASGGFWSPVTPSTAGWSTDCTPPTSQTSPSTGDYSPSFSTSFSQDPASVHARHGGFPTSTQPHHIASARHCSAHSCKPASSVLPNNTAFRDIVKSQPPISLRPTELPSTGTQITNSSSDDAQIFAPASTSTATAPEDADGDEMDEDAESVQREPTPTPLSSKRSVYRWSSGLLAPARSPLAYSHVHIASGPSSTVMQQQQQQQQPAMSDSLSSPTTSSFYGQPPLVTSSSSSRVRPQNARSYKSTSSVRSNESRRVPRASHAASSSPTSLSTVTYNARRMAQLKNGGTIGSSRARIQPKRDLSLGEPDNPFEAGVYGPGAMKEGEWEEWTEEENFMIGLEVMKAKRSWKARYEGQLSSEMDEADLEAYAEIDDAQEEPEPPEDACDQDSTPQAYSPSVPLLPTLAVEPETSSQMQTFSQNTNSSDSQSMSLDSTARPTSVEQPPSWAAVQAFERAIVEAPCPNCHNIGSIIGNEQQGALCQQCGWNVAANILRSTEVAFASHHRDDYINHVPVLSYTPFTGTLVLCSGCDEEWGL
ncbi:hypothetical protein ACM66B_002264 [Microbotryomycetes sp. NB124-2]